MNEDHKPEPAAEIIERLARTTVTQTDEGSEFAIVPSAYTVRRLTGEDAPKSKPSYIIADEQFKTGDSLAEYLNRFKDPATAVFADIDSRQICGIIDYHYSNRIKAEKQESGIVEMRLEDGLTVMTQPDRSMHRASTTLTYSDEFKEWDSEEGKWLSQTEMIEFLEQNATDLLDPSPANILEMVQDFNAIENVTFKSSQNLNNGNRELIFRKESEPAGTVEIPNRLVFEMPIYFGEEAQRFEAIFRHRFSSGSLTLCFKWRRITEAKQRGFDLACERLAAQTGLFVFQGKIPDVRLNGAEPMKITG